MSTDFVASPISRDNEEEVAKASRIFMNTVVRVVRETLPTGSPAERMQLMTTMAVQASTTAAARSFADDLDGDLYEAMILGFASAAGMKLGVVDPLTREHALRVMMHGLHGGIAHAEQMIAEPPKGDA